MEHRTLIQTGHYHIGVGSVGECELDHSTTRNSTAAQLLKQAMPSQTVLETAQLHIRRGSTRPHRGQASSGVQYIVPGTFSGKVVEGHNITKPHGRTGIKYCQGKTNMATSEESREIDQLGEELTLHSGRTSILAESGLKPRLVLYGHRFLGKSGYFPRYG